MNRLINIGIVLLLLGNIAYYLLDPDSYGFWIGALMGSGSILIITGIFRKFS